MAIIMAENIMSNAHLLKCLIFFCGMLIEWVCLFTLKSHCIDMEGTNRKLGPRQSKAAGTNPQPSSRYFSFSRMYPNFKTYWYSTTYSRRNQEQDDSNAFKQLAIVSDTKMPKGTLQLWQKVHCNYGKVSWWTEWCLHTNSSKAWSFYAGCNW